MYICDTCNYTTEWKHNLARHLNRKTPCAKETISSAKETISSAKETISSAKETISSAKETISQQNQDLQCKLCLHTYKRIYTLNNHKCKGAPSNVCPYCYKEFSTPHSKRQHVKNKTCQKNIELVDDETKEIEPDMNLLINNSNNTINSNINSNNTQNIYVNIYGQENVSHVTFTTIMNLIKMYELEDVIKNLFHIKYIEKPENHTMKITNSRGDIVMIHKGDNCWEFADKFTLFNEILDKFNDYLEQIFIIWAEEMQDKLQYTRRKHYKDGISDLKKNKKTSRRAAIRKDFNIQLLNIRDEQGRQNQIELPPL